MCVYVCVYVCTYICYVCSKSTWKVLLKSTKNEINIFFYISDFSWSLSCNHYLVNNGTPNFLWVNHLIKCWFQTAMKHVIKKEIVMDHTKMAGTPKSGIQYIKIIMMKLLLL